MAGKEQAKTGKILQSLVDLDDCEQAPDFDRDNLRGKCDSCPRRANPKQEDADLDGVGDACDGCDTLMIRSAPRM